MRFAPLPLSYFQTQLSSIDRSNVSHALASKVQLEAPGWVIPQLIFFSVWFGLLSLAAMLIVVRKVTVKNFWLVRLLPTARGRLLLVSPTAALPLLQVLFMALYLAMAWLIMLKKAESFGRFLSLLVCLPLLFGGWCCAFAFYFSGTSFRKLSTQRSHGSIFNANNVVFLGAASFSLLVVVTFSCLAGISSERAISRWRLWDTQVKSQIPTAVDIHQAAWIWKQLDMSIFFEQIGFLVYSFLFFCLFGFSSLSGICLYKRINDHLRNNIPILESDRAITDSILSAIAPVNAPERGLTEKSRISILKSSLALVRCVTVSVASTSLLLGALFCYYGVSSHSTFLSDPSTMGKNVGIFLVGIGWATSIGLCPCFIRIGVQAFNNNFSRKTQRTPSVERPATARSQRRNSDAGIRMIAPQSIKRKDLEFGCSGQHDAPNLDSPSSFNSPLTHMPNTLFHSPGEAVSVALSTPTSLVSKTEYGFGKAGQDNEGAEGVEEIRRQSNSTDEIAFSFNSTSAPSSTRGSVSLSIHRDQPTRPASRASRNSQPPQTATSASRGIPSQSIREDTTPNTESEPEAEVGQAARTSKSIELLISAMREEFSGPRPKWSAPKEW